MAGEPTEGAVGPKIVRGRVDSLSLYEITDYELQALEDGSLGTTYLNFAIFFGSVAASFLATLLTAVKLTDRTFTVFVVIIVIGFAAAAVLLVIWRKTRKRMTKILKRIRDRCVADVPPPVSQDTEQADACDESAG